MFSFAEPCDNMREILQNVAKLQGVSNMRKLGHLNNFTKVRAQMVSQIKWSYRENVMYVLYQRLAGRLIKQLGVMEHHLKSPVGE